MATGQINVVKNSLNNVVKGQINVVNHKKINVVTGQINHMSNNDTHTNLGFVFLIFNKNKSV